MHFLLYHHKTKEAAHRRFLILYLYSCSLVSSLIFNNHSHITELLYPFGNQFVDIALA